MTWDNLSKEDQQRAGEILADLRDAGIATNVSQVAANFGLADRWAAGQVNLVTLTKQAGWDTSGMRPLYVQDQRDLTWRVALPVGQFTEVWSVARDAATDVPGDHGDFITLSARTKSGLHARNLPVIGVRQRNGATVRQILTGERTEEVDGLTTALIPVGGPLVGELAPCPECTIDCGTILRRDSAGNVGFLCEEDEQRGAFTKRPFPTS